MQECAEAAGGGFNFHCSERTRGTETAVELAYFSGRPADVYVGVEASTNPDEGSERVGIGSYEENSKRICH